MSLRRETLESLLCELADYMLVHGCGPVEWTVCGGAAMSLQEIHTRTTRDVDVLGNWDSQQDTIQCIGSFDEGIGECIEKVAREHHELDIEKGWVNLGARNIAERGLPQGFEGRAKRMEFGGKGNLVLHLLGRQDLLSLKLCAASDDLGRRQNVHIADLKTLSPRYDEIETALEWLKGRSDYNEKQPALKSVVEELGHDDLAYYI
jgi:hypothetical protein